MKTKVIFSWSGGKDSAYALYKILNHPNYEVKYLITTITEGYNRISMHGIPIDLLKMQAESIGIPLYMVKIPANCTNDDYNQAMLKALSHFILQGIYTVIYGDIFLQDIREFRIKQLSELGMKAVFPLWGENTGTLAREFLGAGFKTIISCIDTRIVDQSFSGKLYDENFLAAIPPECDPCGENGEFHSFVFDGPIFSNKIFVKAGGKIMRDKHFCYTDILAGK